MEALIKALNRKETRFPTARLYAVRGRIGRERLMKRKDVETGSICYDLSSAEMWMKKRRWVKVPGT